MSPIIPNHIGKAKITELPLTYKWDDDIHEDVYFAKEVPALRRKIAKISKRSQLILAAGMAEWVAWHLSKHSEDRMLFDCIEGTYASIIDWQYFDSDIPSKDLAWKTWEGSIRMPMCLAARRLITMIEKARTDMATARHAVFMSNLVEHMLPKNVKLFRNWRNGVIDRLKALEPLNRSNPAGNSMPREVLDLSKDFDKSTSENFLAKFIESLKPTNNRYLRSPEAMLEDGFEGTPYKL